jgi:holo-[acyl-carrier protein] synthase
MPMRVGIDLVRVDSIEESLDTHGEHYLHRVYTERELRDCATPDGVDCKRLAGRFAAKEAAIKVLRPGKEDALPWSSLEVIRHPSGWVALELDGPAAVMADKAGIVDLQLSITHENLQACAVVVAELREGCR